MRNELRVYQKFCLAFDRSTPVLEWIASQRVRCPHVVLLAQSIFTIPGSQIECERVFSIAGIISKNRRNKIGVSSIDKIVSIYYTLPENVIPTKVDRADDLDALIDAEISHESELLEDIEN